MSTIRPVQFPRVDSEALKQSGSVPAYSPAQKKAPQPVEQQPDRINTGTQTSKAAQNEGISNPPPEETKTPGVRFYNPRSVKVKSVPELGKHIDVRV